MIGFGLICIIIASFVFAAAITDSTSDTGKKIFIEVLWFIETIIILLLGKFIFGAW